MPKVDWTKPITNKLGHTLRCVGSYKSNYGARYIIVGPHSDGVSEFMYEVDVEGYYTHNGGYNIINVPPPKKKAWTVLHVSRNPGFYPMSSTYDTKADSDAFITQLGNRFVKLVEWEYEGEVK